VPGVAHGIFLNRIFKKIRFLKKKMLAYVTSGTQGFLQKNFSLFGLVVWPAIAAYMSRVLYLIDNNNNNNNTRFTTVQIRFKFFCFFKLFIFICKMTCAFRAYKKQ